MARVLCVGHTSSVYVLFASGRHPTLGGAGSKPGGPAGRGCAQGHWCSPLLVLFGVVWVGLGCAPALPAGPAPVSEYAQPSDLRWAPVTVSPQPGAIGRLYPASCQRPDAGLERAATLMAERKVALGRRLELTEVHFALRSAGVPQVWPRVWTLEGPELRAADVRSQLGAWLQAHNSQGQTRCGVWRVVGEDGLHVVVALAVDALADLEALPAQAQAGQWLRLEARLLSPAYQGGQVVLLGPAGRPRKVTTKAWGGRISSAFSLEEAGLWRVQLNSRGPNGPRPVLEAWVFVEQPPYVRFHITPAPGEEVWVGLRAGQRRIDELVYDMLNRARQSEGLVRLRRDGRLDALAQAHAEAMRAARRTGHDVGDGPPYIRVKRAGLQVRKVGENVARAQSPVQAHRALWQSPSHRSTLLSDFGAVGIGIARADVTVAVGGLPTATDVWVCQLFVD